jgi:hypothetical protein
MDMKLNSVPQLEWRSPETWVLIMLWLTAAVCGFLAWLLHQTILSVVTGLAGFLFIVALIWVLARVSPRAEDLPELTRAGKPRLSFSVRMVFLLGAALATFIVGLMIGTGAAPVLISGLTGLGLILVWRRDLNQRLLFAGAGVGLVCGLGILLLGNGDLSWAVFSGLCLPPSFISGILLLKRTGLARCRWMEGDLVPGLRSFLWGCALALPGALLNLLGNLQGGDSWVRHAWQPLFALIPALGEETWARLFLTTLCYAVLRPVSSYHPRWAVGVAVLIGALVHGFGHTGIDLFGLIIGSLLYGLPSALLFIKKDFEHAVGYHFLIDFVRFIAALLNG